MRSLFSTYPFLIPLVVLVLSEATKILTDSVREGGFAIHRAFHPGGMPSTHSGFVTSLLIVVARVAGVESLAFTIAFVFACVIWYDAMSLRREVGEQAKVLNLLQKRVKFWDRAGHSFKEVLSGIAFGAVVTWGGIVLVS